MSKCRICHGTYQNFRKHRASDKHRRSFHNPANWTRVGKRLVVRGVDAKPTLTAEPDWDDGGDNTGIFFPGGVFFPRPR